MKRSKELILAGLPLALASAAGAQTPRGLQDLVGARTAGAENAMQSRGCVNVRSEQGDDRSYTD